MFTPRRTQWANWPGDAGAVAIAGNAEIDEIAVGEVAPVSTLACGRARR